ncbi:uncharacterized protein [Acropora muricata]|uniref:uncharacterized protein isoform X3 n=1 Tax=Acropora muricata TaxID=159855 RepID=UPI0034E48124
MKTLILMKVAFQSTPVYTKISEPISPKRNVRPLDREGSRDPEWQVIVENTLTKENRTLQFEAVVVCNGHFSVPYEPVILGVDSFPGLLMHSHCYRRPDTFQGKRVVILGGSFSGQDICLEVAECADMVYLSHKKFLPSKLPGNVEQHRPISSVSGDGTVQFDDGQQRKADAILLCTGYRFSFPFLDHECGIQVANNRVTHLYKHIFDIKYPTLSFIGIPLRVCGIFTLINLQAQFITAVLSKQRHLPSEDEMRADEESELQERLCRGLHEKYAHVLAEGQFDYNNTIALLVGVDRPGSFHKSICKHAVNRLSQSLMSYKTDEYKLTSDGMWTFKEFHT